MYVSQQPNLMVLKDTNGDDKADTRELIMHGFDTADSHHAMHAFTWDPGGALYWQEGTFHHSSGRDALRAPRLAKEAGIFRLEPEDHQVRHLRLVRLRQPLGPFLRQAWGQNFVADASGGANYYGTAFSGQVDYPRSMET